MITSIKFFYNGLRLDGARTLVRCGYSLDLDAETVTIYARGGSRLPSELFPVENDTDLYTDYFDDDHAELTPAHPLYKFAVYAASRAKLREVKARAAYLAGRIAHPSAYDAHNLDALRTELAAVDSRRAALEAIPNPGQPTAADLAAVDQMKQDAESAARAAEQAEEQRRREEALAESAAARAIVREEVLASPLTDGEPYAIFGFSESAAFDDFRTESGEPRCICSIAAADAITRRLDLLYNPAQTVPHDYRKTDVTIYYPAAGGQWQSYAARLDLGTEYGGLVEHVRRHGEQLRTPNRYCTPSADDLTTAAAILALADRLARCTTPADDPAGEVAEAPASAPAWRPVVACAQHPAEAPAAQVPGNPAEAPAESTAPAGIISVTFAPELLEALRREHPAAQVSGNPAEAPARHPAAQVSGNPAEAPAEHPAGEVADTPADDPATAEEVDQLRGLLRTLSDTELAACLFHVDPHADDARPLGALFLREMSRRDPARSFATFKAWRAGNIPPEVRALLDDLSDGDPDGGG